MRRNGNRGWLLALAWVAFLSAPGSSENAGGTPSGAWRASDGSGDLVWFGESRCALFISGDRAQGPPDTEVLGISFYRVSQVEGRTVLEFWGRRTEIEVQREGSRLVIRQGSRFRSFEPLDEMPPEFRFEPQPLGEALELSAEETDAIRDELRRRATLDQEVREDPEASLPEIDLDNASFIAALVRRVGWVDVRRFGVESSFYAWLLVQHSGNIPLMMAVLPALERDVRAGVMKPGPYALLYDRLQIDLGYPQRYGSQIGIDDAGRSVVLPLEDRSRLDEAREELGLPPYSEYVDLLLEQYGGDPPAFME